MKVVVTGGTGFVGRALVVALVARGDDVVVLSRGHGAVAGARSVRWSPGERGGWESELVGAQAIVGLAGAGLFDERWTEARLREVRASRVDATAVLAASIADRAPTATFVNASAVGAYGMRSDDAILDESSPRCDDALSRLCAEWESAAEPAAVAGARLCIARLGIVVGRGGGALEAMLPAFRAFVGGPLGDGRQWLSWVHLADTVRALMFLIDNEACRGVFNVTAPEPATMNEFSTVLAATLHRPRLFRVPGFALKMVMGSGRADALLTGQRALPTRLLKEGFTFRFPRLEAAMADACGRPAQTG